MERYETLNLIAKPADVAIGLVMKTAQAAGAYEPVRSWIYSQIKDNLLAGFQKKNQLEVIGLENVPNQGGAILAANHQSWLDVQAWGSSCKREIHFIAKSEFTEWPILSKLIELTESVYVARGGSEDGFSDIESRLKQGWLVGIFPEGTIPGEEEIGRDQLQPETGLLRGHTGMIRMALAARVPIIPVGISGTGLAFPPEAYPRLEMPPIQKPEQIAIRYGKPIHFRKYKSDTIDHETLRRLTDRVMKEISDLVDHKRCFIPLEIPIKTPDTTGLKSYPKSGRKAPFGILVLHGFTSHLDCVAGLEPFLKEMKLPYRFPILRGHGTVPHDMIGTTAQDWYEDAEKALLDLSRHCKKIIVCGLSMGGLVSIDLGIKHKEIISHVVLIAAALRFADPMSGLTPVLSKIFKFWDSPSAYHDPQLAEKRDKNYRVFATDAFTSLYSYSKEIEQHLGSFDRPVFIIHSKKDQVIAPKSAEIIFRNISTPKDSKKIKWFKKSGHEMCLDLEADEVLGSITGYIKTVTN